MQYSAIMQQVTIDYQQILQANLVGIYMHGSIAFGCFRWETSDIDFLVVTKQEPTPQQKVALIQSLLTLEQYCPPKGMEMSVVLEQHCRNFCYPTPYCLHFSNTHLAACTSSIESYCAAMNGTDKDLAAHFTVTRAVGITLCGEDISTLFGPVPPEDYLDSILYDVANAQQEMMDNPVYFILNLCRVLAYLQEGLVISKAQGGCWGMERLPAEYRNLVHAALAGYTGEADIPINDLLACDFAGYMLGRLAYLKKQKAPFQKS